MQKPGILTFLKISQERQGIFRDAVMMIIDVYAPTHTLFVTHAPSKAYDYTMGVADARLMT